MSSTEIIERDSPEWNRMWKMLANLPLNNGDTVCLNQDEVWQYLGTVNGEHEFRHRCHPSTNQREYLTIPYVEDETSSIL